ncbi:uncharacterized protein TNCV_960761 [Trichonephila clavipes]|nr:uncharacterized protein TNCV_960761 [Trichonephila clavipes]
MDHNSYSDVSKNPQSAFCGAISGSVCFPMPLMYSPMNSYQLMPNLASFLPMPHPMLSNHALQDSLMLSNNDIMSGNQLAKGDDYSTRALAMLQNRYQMKNYLLPSARKPMGKYCMMPSPLLDASSDGSKHALSSYGAIQNNGDSNGSGILPPMTSTTSPISGSYTDKECYLSSPNTEVEEPDSSGKCSTDVVEQKGPLRYGVALNSRRAASPLVKLVEGEEMWEALTPRAGMVNQWRVDEAHFWLNDYVNKQNCRIWSEANLQVYVETPLHPEKLTVWCALWAGGILLQKR